MTFCRPISWNSLPDSLKDINLTLQTFKRHLKTFLFYSARNARIASAVLATAISSVRPSVCHTPVLCQNDGT